MANPLRVLIVDDETAARRRLVALVDALEGVEIAGEAASGVEALELVRAGRPDVILLDIAMPEVDGFEVARHLPEPKPLVIFQTAYDAYALEAFEHEAVDYVLKPVTAKRLAQALDRARRRLAGGAGSALTPELVARLESTLGHTRAARPSRILVRFAAGHRLLPLRDIVRFTADESLVHAHAGPAQYLTDYTLSELEERTRGRFVRTSRAELVNLDRVERIASNGDGSATLTMADGTAVRVSRRRAADVKRAIENA